jgi:transposase
MRLGRRANALLLLDDGLSCEAVAKVLYLDDDTIRYWYKLYHEKGLSWLADFGYKGRPCELTASQQEELKKWVTETLPRTTSVVGEWIEKSYGIRLYPLSSGQASQTHWHEPSQAQGHAEQA